MSSFSSVPVGDGDGMLVVGEEADDEAGASMCARSPPRVRNFNAIRPGLIDSEASSTHEPFSLRCIPHRIDFLESICLDHVATLSAQPDWWHGLPQVHGVETTDADWEVLLPAGEKLSQASRQFKAAT